MCVRYDGARARQAQIYANRDYCASAPTHMHTAPTCVCVS